MITLLALFGALVFGLLVGLAYRGLVVFGDQRKLDIMVEQLQTETRMRQATNRVLAEMRTVAKEQFRSGQH